MKLAIKTTIHQPVEKVFEYIADPRNEMHWNADLIAVEGGDWSQWGVGSTCTMIFEDAQIAITVTDFVPNQRYGFKSAYGTSLYQMRGNAERTRLVFEMDIIVRGIILQTLKRAALRRSLETRLEANFKRLKEILESPTVAEGYADEEPSRL